MNNIDELIERYESWVKGMEAVGMDRGTHYHPLLQLADEMYAALRVMNKVPMNAKDIEAVIITYVEQLEDLQKTVERAEPCLRELQSDARYYSAKAEAALEENKNLCERIAELESTVEAYRENRAGQYKRQRDAALADLDELRDRLKNGIKYDEELNCYVVVWTEREIENARRQADEISKRIRGMK